MNLLNPDDPNQNQPASESTTPTPGGEPQATGEQPGSQPSQPTAGGETTAPPQKCVTCGNATSGGTCVACGQGEVTCTCPQAQGGAGSTSGTPA